MKFLTLAFSTLILTVAFRLLFIQTTPPEEREDSICELQRMAIESNLANWGHWGTRPGDFTGWTSHSNRLIPIYTFGISLDQFTGSNSVYRDASRLKDIYYRMPELTLNERADYMDQTDVYRLQKQAIEQGKKYIILIVFDGMDWQTTLAAAIYRSRDVTYTRGRGNGLAFQDYDKAETDFGFFVSSPFNDTTHVDVNAQIVTGRNDQPFGGYNPDVGGYEPWELPTSYRYLLSLDPAIPHAYTDSASSATSLNCGIKTYNGAINVDPDGNHAVPLPRKLQQQGFSIGAVTSVPFCHATPATVYANNVTRDDYQDLSRDMLGLSSIANRRPLPGMDVLIGCGWGKNALTNKAIRAEIKSQGSNFVPGNKYLADDELVSIDVNNGGRYQIAQRQTGKCGRAVLEEATQKALKGGHRLFGLFGTSDGHLPFATANGDFVPTVGESELEEYTVDDLSGNPTLRDMTVSALSLLEQNETGFWLLVEAGDVDWANHENNIDNSIGAVFSGEAAFEAVCDWAEKNNCWNETAVIVTADHGHLFVIDKPDALIPKPR